MRAPAKPQLHLNFPLQPKPFELLQILKKTGYDAPQWVGAGGAKGGGKSFALRLIALLLLFELAEQYPGVIITIVRRVSRDLIDNHIDPLFRQFPALRDYWHAADDQLILPGGGVLSFRFAENEDDVKRKFLGGYESMFIFVDEAQQFTEQELKDIQTAARWTHSSGVKPGLPKIVLLFNPGGKGSAFIRRIFWLKQYTDREIPSAYDFIHIFGFDNYEWFRGQTEIRIEDFYEAEWMRVRGTPPNPGNVQIPLKCDREDDDHSAATPRRDTCCRFHTFIRYTTEGRKYNAYPIAMRVGFLLGSFEQFAGQYYAGVWDESKVLISPTVAEQIVQAWFPHWTGSDWGFSDHAATVWAATGRIGPEQLKQFLGVDADFSVDIVVIKRELVVKGMGEVTWAQTISDVTPIHEKRVMKEFYLSPDAWNVRGSENTVEAMVSPTLRRNEMPRAEKADNDRVGGWRLIWNMLKQTCSVRSDVPTCVPGIPMLLISSACPTLAQSMPDLIVDPKNPNDVMKMKSTDNPTEDISDSLRYAMKSKLSPRSTAPAEDRFREQTKFMQTPNQIAMAERNFREKEGRKRTTHFRPRLRDIR